MTQTLSTGSQPLGSRQQALVDALRSGQFTQATGYLKVGDSYCCMGVAAKLAGAKWDRTDDTFNKDAGLSLKDSFVKLSDELIDWYGFRSGEGMTLIEGLSARRVLSMMNDGGGVNNEKRHSFAEIASFIEQNPAAVFTESL